MIIWGIVLTIFGAIFYHNGVQTNNSLEAQMESIFNDGVSNPGSTNVTIGVILMLVGILLVIIGIVNYYNEEKTTTAVRYTPSRMPTERQQTNFIRNRCAHCGAFLSDDDIFCPTCGKENSNFKHCPNCNERISVNKSFCKHCGAEIILYTYSLQNGTVEDIVNAAFNCLEKRDFENAKKLLDSAGQKEPNNARVSLGKLLAELEVQNVDKLSDVQEDFSIRVHYHNIMQNGDDSLKEQVQNALVNIKNSKTYTRAMDAFRNGNYRHASELFNSLNVWKDSKEKAIVCKEKLVAEERELARKSRIKKIAVWICVILVLIYVICTNV